MSPFNEKNILLKVTGSIAAYKACELISLLKKSGAEIKVVASESALKFVGSATWEGLLGAPVCSDTFATGQAMSHIDLSRWADMVLLYPATANTINKLANGIADDLIGSLFLSYEINKKPYFIAPAMNTKMLEHPTVQRSLNNLASMGYTILPTEEGELACGEVGAGKVCPPESALQIISKACAPIPSPKKGKILITAGATQEPLDSVRFITNFSSGRTGAELADHFIRLGYEVDFLHGKSSAKPQNSNVKNMVFQSFSELEKMAQALLQNNDYKAFIHSAAVSDYSLESLIIDGKKESKNPQFKLNSQNKLSLNLKQNPKIISKILKWSKNPNILLVGFKLTSGLSDKEALQKVKTLFTSSGCHYVVQNELKNVKATEHIFNIYNPLLSKINTGTTKKQLCKSLEEIVSQFSAPDSPQASSKKKSFALEVEKNDFMS